MRKLALILLAVGAAAVLLAVVHGGGPAAGSASSHREAPLIAEDPTADNTDLYAFRSPDKPDTATIISNVIPGEDPAAGPNWYTFSPSARYDIYVDKNGDGKADVSYYFRFKAGEPTAFLGGTAQPYTVTKVEGKTSTVVGSGLMTPPDNIGPKTFGNKPYRDLAAAGVHDLSDGTKVFAGQRDDAFFGDIGAAFDLVAIRYGHRRDRRRQGLLRRLRRARDRLADPDLAARQRHATTRLACGRPRIDRRSPCP